MWKISQFDNHYCVCGLFPPFYGFFPLFVARFVNSFKPQLKENSSILQETSLIHSHVQTNLPPKAYKLVYTQNLNLIQMWLGEKIRLLSPLLDSIGMQHIFTHLPLMPSMFWHLHQVNKAWFLVVGKSFPWNALSKGRENRS